MISRALAAAMFASGIVYSVFAYASFVGWSSIGDDWRYLEDVSAPRGAASVGVVEALGYGGFIQYYKRSIIRTDLEWVERARLRGGEVIGALTKLGVYARNPE